MVELLTAENRSSLGHYLKQELAGKQTDAAFVTKRTFAGDPRNAFALSVEKSRLEVSGK